MRVDARTLAFSIETRGRMLSDGARLFAKLHDENLVKLKDVFRSMDMVKARLDDEWQLFVLQYEAETNRLRETPL